MIYLKTFQFNRNLMRKYQFAVLALMLSCKTNNVMQYVVLAVLKLENKIENGCNYSIVAVNEWSLSVDQHYQNDKKRKLSANVLSQFR